MNSGRDCLLQPPQLDEHEALALLIMSRFGSIPDPFGSLLPVPQGPHQGFPGPSAAACGTASPTAAS